MFKRVFWLPVFISAVFIAGFSAKSLAAEKKIKLIDRNISIDESIKRNRMGTITIKTQPNAEVKVTQLRHEFLFGTCVNAMMWSEWDDFKSQRDWPLDFEHMNDPSARGFIMTNKELYKKTILDNFNYAVHQNDIKWFCTEQRRSGDIYYTAAERVSNWCADNDIQMRGHCLFWAKGMFVQDWQRQLSDDELKARLQQHCKDVVSRFKGQIKAWDLNNEMIAGNYYRERFGDEIIGEMCKWVHEVDPEIKIYLNDYDILVRGFSLDKYLEQIKHFLELGFPFEGIGIQAHSWWVGKHDEEFIKDALDKLAATGLDLKITEYVANNWAKDDKERAGYLRDFYRVCFAHPAVDAVVMWGFWEGAMWLDEYGLYERDWRANELAKAYRDLVFNQWWTKFQGRADGNGVCEVPAFFGKHQIESNGIKQDIELKKAQKSIQVNLLAR